MSPALPGGYGCQIQYSVIPRERSILRRALVSSFIGWRHGPVCPAGSFHGQVARKPPADISHPARLEHPVNFTESLLLVPPELVRSPGNNYIRKIILKGKLLGASAFTASTLSQACFLGFLTKIIEKIGVDVRIDPAHFLSEFAKLQAQVSGTAPQIDPQTFLVFQPELGHYLLGQGSINRATLVLARRIIFSAASLEVQ